MKYSRLIFLLALLCGAPAAAICQAQVAGPKLPDCTNPLSRSTTKSSRVISLGVLNARALRLVKPDFPPAALYVKARGSVVIQILVDEIGCVTQATAVSGHPLLILASLKAAEASLFEPVLLSGHPVRVNGVIVYNYNLGPMNWLELGFFSDSFEALLENLPAGFGVESALLRQAYELSWDEKQKVLATVKASLAASLLTNEKDKWLFETGGYLKKLNSGYFGNMASELACTPLRTQLNNVPATVSPQLKHMLEELLSLKETTEIRKKLREIEERLFALGE